jgi:lipopolysaccharide biosynthesis glycosyltransferase
LGGYYRLFANRVLPKDVMTALYMDQDIVILANLGNLFSYTNSSYLFQWSATSKPNSGFVLLHLSKFEQFWELLDKLPEITHGSDQALMQMLARANNPDVIGGLPPAWDTHTGHGWFQIPHKLLEKGRHEVGMLHFTGVKARSYYLDRLEYFCRRARDCKKDTIGFGKTWGLADYYIRLPWEWARYFGKSLVRDGKEGHSLGFRQIEAVSSRTDSP